MKASSVCSARKSAGFVYKKGRFLKKNMKKKFWVISLTIVVFLCAIVLGSATVFRVEKVTVETVAVSDQAKTEAQALEKKIRESFYGENALFLDLQEVEALTAEFSYLNVTSVEKAYPDGILVKVTEEKERYAVAYENGYYILNQNGKVLTTKDTPVNRLDGELNLLLEGFSFTGEANGTLVGDDAFSTALSVLQFADEALGGVRLNVLALRLVNRSPETIICLTMREGVKVYLGDASTSAKEKVQKAIDKYTVLSDEERGEGRLLVSEVEGELVVSYSKTDEFQE